MSDAVGAIEVFHGGHWRRAAEIHRLGGEARLDPTILEYDVDYTASFLGGRGVEAVSLRHPVDFTLHRLDALPAFCIDMMPQGEARRLVLAKLTREDRAQTDWAVLTRGAGNPVGNARVAEAVEERPEPHPGVARSELIARGDGYRAWAEAQGIPMTGSSDTGGASPKLLMTEDVDGALHADGALADERAHRHFVVKFPRGRTRADALVLATEAPYLEVVRALGMRCGDALTHHEPGVLFVPRFDRASTAEGVERRGMESGYALMGVVEAGVTLAFESLCQAVAAVVDDPAGDVIELVLRDACCLALGNPDNHGRNTALLKHPDGGIELSPVYDFAPMYLDPEGIRRQTRWRSERGGRVDWSDVCVALEDLVDRGRLAGAMRRLAERLEDAPRLMRDLGVDPSVVGDRERPIANVARELAEVEG